MSIGHTVLMPGLHDTGAQTTALKTALADVAQVLTPDITGSTTSTVILEDPALTVLGALSAAGADEFATPPRFIHAGRMRDYLKWHDAYDDPDSDLSWRLDQVRAHIRGALDGVEGPVTVLSLCAGDGRDVLPVLAERGDPSAVRTTLIELHPVLAQRARDFAAEAGLTGVMVRTGDAGNTTAYAGSVPADLVIMMGIFGNISDDDVRRTIQAAPQLCRPGAMLLWSRGTNGTDGNASVRAWLTEAGFAELDYLEFDDAAGERAALGSARYDGPFKPLIPGRQLFTFLR